ncbi:hypothetical protein DY000_02055100 [Brassica cretica]|uniref:Uncharacterized protein n=1 Tax=Brassica cretica TaxID=69181 RepID=A0ABQ7AFZ1_BRACR|nr:hypothetical protein DY000_02055100 [Brassica cretica]
MNQAVSLCGIRVSSAELTDCISRQPTTTMSLFPREAPSMEMEAAQDVKPKNLFPRQRSFSFSSSSLPKEDDVLKMTQTTTTRYPTQRSSQSVFKANWRQQYNFLARFSSSNMTEPPQTVPGYSF